MSYNGWANIETWLVNLHVDVWLHQIVDEGGDVTEDMLREFFKDLQYGMEGTENGLLNDLLTTAYERVNWAEIASKYER